MKKFIISTVFTVAAAFIFMVSFSMVSGVNNSYALQGSQMTGSGKMITAKKNSKTKNDANKSKKKLNKMGAGCL
ncbi:MAG: hypothetical protein M0012_07415 [Deltaproteobacteria bacterium]|nr:hypothetical protein [Deltaproteobacteria bacterium]